MSIRIVRLGTERQPKEGTRIGTVRRPPRGVPRTEYASQNWYDVWLPNIAPSAELMKLGKAAESDKEWAVFVRKYRARWQILTRAEFWICLPPCLTKQIYLWAVTARMKNGVTGPYLGNCWPREELI